RSSVAVDELLSRVVLFRGGETHADPSGSCKTFCTDPFPKVVSPTRMARFKSFSAPDTISAPLALPSLTNTASGKCGRSFAVDEVVYSRPCDAARPWVETTIVFGGRNWAQTSTAVLIRPPGLFRN